MKRSQKDPKLAEKLAKLKKIPVDQIRKMNSVVVDIPIGELSLKDSHRTIYVLGSTLIQVREITNRLADTFENRERAITKLIEDIKKDDPENTMLERLIKLLIPKEELERKMREGANNTTTTTQVIPEQTNV